jgi:hypothetical protein
MTRSHLVHVFETYELFISLIFICFGGLWWTGATETVDTESADTGAWLYLGLSECDTMLWGEWF